MSSLPVPIAVFLAGLLSFLSPCVLPLVPGYVSLISGTSVDQLQSADRKLSRTVLLNSLMFILGFSVVFIALGAVATGIGQFMNIYRRQGEDARLAQFKCVEFVEELLYGDLRKEPLK